MNSPGEGEREGRERRKDRETETETGRREQGPPTPPSRVRDGEQTARWASGQGKRMLSRLALTAGSESEDTPRGDSGDSGPGVQFLTTTDSCTSGFPLLRQRPQARPREPVGRGGGQTYDESKPWSLRLELLLCPFLLLQPERFKVQGEDRHC